MAGTSGAVKRESTFMQGVAVSVARVGAVFDVKGGLGVAGRLRRARGKAERIRQDNRIIFPLK